MILSVIKYFQGYVRISLTGYDMERFMNLCGQKNILIWNITLLEDSFLCNMSIQGFWSIRPICHKTHTRLRIIKRYGFPFLLHKYKKRWIFFACFLIALLSLRLASQHVWKIEVQGNASIDAQEILLFLENHHCGYGDKIEELNLEQLEAELRSYYTDVIWTSIELDGTCVTVSIKENLLLSQENPQKLDEHQGYDLISEQEGCITSIITRSGTPKVAAKDMVKAGDVLISGCLPIYNDAKEVIAYVPVVADGDITLDFTRTYQKKFSLTHVKKKDTGLRRQLFYPEINGYYPKHLISLFHLPSSDEIIEKKQLCLWDNYYLPIYWCRLTQQEYDKVTETYTKEEAIEKGNDYFAKYCNKLQQKGVQTIDKNVMITFKDGYCYVSGQMTVRQQVGKYQKTSLPKLPNFDEGQLEE